MVNRIVSFGFKHGLPAGHGMVIDLRSAKWGFRNPYWIGSFRDLPGTHPAVAVYLEQDRHFDQNYQALKAMIKEGEGVCYLGCVGGRHRSVYLADRLGRELGIPVNHRDCEGV